MSKKVDDTLVPVPVKLLAQLKAMSAFHRYQTWNVNEYVPTMVRDSISEIIRHSGM